MGRTSNAKEKLLDTAMLLVRGGSYFSVSVDDLCLHADVRKGSFYHFFESKQHLLFAAVDAWWANLKHDVLQPEAAANKPPLERIRLFLEAAVNQNRKTTASYGKVVGCPLGNLALELSTQDEEIRQRLEAVFEEFSDYLAACLTQAVEDGEIPPHPVAQTARALIAQFYGTILLAKVHNNLEYFTDLPDRAMRLIPRTNA